MELFSQILSMLIALITLIVTIIKIRKPDNGKNKIKIETHQSIKDSHDVIINYDESKTNITAKPYNTKEEQPIKQPTYVNLQFVIDIIGLLFLAAGFLYGCIWYIPLSISLTAFFVVPYVSISIYNMFKGLSNLKPIVLMLYTVTCIIIVSLICNNFFASDNYTHFLKEIQSVSSFSMLIFTFLKSAWNGLYLVLCVSSMCIMILPIINQYVNRFLSFVFKQAKQKESNGMLIGVSLLAVFIFVGINYLSSFSR